MGGRGARSGVSVKGKKYGTEYHTLHESGNIKFVRYNGSKATTTPMETMTNGRVYATVNMANEVKSITYYDKKGKRYKQIDLNHPHNVNGVSKMPHTHKGYVHDEHGTRQTSQKENKMIERVSKIWKNKSK